MLEKQNGNYTYTLKNPEECRIRDVLTKMSLQNSDLAKRLFHLFNQFKVKIDSSVIVKMALDNADFARLAINSRIFDKLDSKSLSEIAKIHPKLVINIFHLRQEAIMKYGVFSDLTKNNVFIQELIKNPSFIDEIPDDNILLMALHNEDFTYAIANSYHINLLRGFNIVKIVKKHNGILDIIKGRMDIVNRLIKDNSLADLCKEDSDFAIFCIENPNLRNKLNGASDLFKRDEGIAKLALEYEIDASWDSIIQIFPSLGQYLHQHPDILKKISRDNLVKLAQKNEKLALEIIDNPEFRVEKSMFYKYLSYAHESVTKEYFENSLKEIGTYNYPLWDILNLVVPYSQLAQEFFMIEKFQQVLTENLNYQNILSYDEFVELYIQDPIGALKKAKHLDVCDIINIAEYHRSVMHRILQDEELIFNDAWGGNVNYVKIGIAHTEFANHLLSLINEEPFKKSGIDMIMNIACGNAEFANHLLDRPDILYKAQKDYLYKIMDKDDYIINFIINDQELMSDEWPKTVYDFMLQHEEFALAFIIKNNFIDGCSLRKVALEYESVALELLNHPILLNEMRFDDLVTIAQKFSSFAVNMLDSALTRKTLNQDTFYYHKILDICKLHPEFASKLVSNKQKFIWFSGQGTLNQFLTQHPEYTTKFLDSPNLSYSTICKRAEQSKEFAISLLNNLKYVFVTHSIINKCNEDYYNNNLYRGRDVIVKLAKAHKEFAIELFKHPELLDVLSVENIYDLAICHEEFLYKFMDEYNLWSDLYGNKPQEIKYEKLIFDLFLTKQEYDEKEISELFIDTMTGTQQAASIKPIPGVLVLLYAVVTNPGIIEYIEEQSLQDPCHDNTTIDDAAEIAKYAMAMSGESEMSDCTLM